MPRPEKPKVVLVEPDQHWSDDFTRATEPHVATAHFMTCGEALSYVDENPDILAVVVSQDVSDPHEISKLDDLLVSNLTPIISTSEHGQVADNTVTHLSWRWLRKLESANLINEYARAQGKLLQVAFRDSEVAAQLVKKYIQEHQCDPLRAMLELGMKAEAAMSNREFEATDDGEPIITPYVSLGPGETPVIEELC